MGAWSRAPAERGLGEDRRCGHAHSPPPVFLSPCLTAQAVCPQAGNRLRSKSASKNLLFGPGKLGAHLPPKDNTCIAPRTSAPHRGSPQEPGPPKCSATDRVRAHRVQAESAAWQTTLGARSTEAPRQRGQGGFPTSHPPPQLANGQWASNFKLHMVMPRGRKGL